MISAQVLKRALQGFPEDPRDAAFGSLAFEDPLRRQYNNGLRRYVVFCKGRGADPAEAVVFVRPDGSVKTDVLEAFANHLHDRDDATDSVYRNCMPRGVSFPRGKGWVVAKTV